MALLGFSGTGMFVSEIVRNRQQALRYVQEMETQIRLRHESEGQLKGLVESSPLAIITIDATAIYYWQMTPPKTSSLQMMPDRRPTNRRIPSALQTAMQKPPGQLFRTKFAAAESARPGTFFLPPFGFPLRSRLPELDVCDRHGFLGGPSRS